MNYRELMMKALQMDMDDLSKQITLSKAHTKTLEDAYKMRIKDGEMTTEMKKRREKKNSSKPDFVKAIEQQQRANKA